MRRLLFACPILAAAALAVVALKGPPSPTRAQETATPPETQPTPPVAGAAAVVRTRVLSAGEPSAAQAAALRRARLEQDLILAERTAGMLRAFETGLQRMRAEAGP